MNEFFITLSEDPFTNILEEVNRHCFLFLFRVQRSYLHFSFTYKNSVDFLNSLNNQENRGDKFTYMYLHDIRLDDKHIPEYDNLGIPGTKKYRNINYILKRTKNF